MSRSPKYSLVRASEERRQRLERERQERERRRRDAEAARAKAALENARRQAGEQLDATASRSAETSVKAGATAGDQKPVLAVIEEVRQSLRRATTVKEVSRAIRRLDEISGMAERVARHAEQRRIATALVEEVGARLAGLQADAAQTRIPLEELALAEGALSMIRSELSADRPEEAEQLAEHLANRLDDIELELDSAIERISARREMLGAIVDALPALGFAVEAGSLVEEANGTIGIQASRRTGEALAVVVQDDEHDKFRVNYLRATGSTGTAVMDAQSCTSLASLAEHLNESVRGTGFDPSAVTWDGDDGRRPPPGAGGTAAAPKPGPAARRGETS